MNEQPMGGQAAALPKLKSLNDLLKGSWELYKKHFNTLVPIVLVAGIGLYLQTLFMYTNGNGRTVDATGSALLLISSLIYIVGMLWGCSALLNKVHKIDQPMTLKQAFMNAKPLIWPVFLTGLLAGILTLIGFVLLIIPGIIVGVWLAFAMYVVVAENKKGADALRASKSYVEGYWWPVFGRLVVVVLIMGLISAIAGSIAQMILGYTLGTLVQNVISLILIPFAIIYEYDMYKNVKQLKGGSAPVSAPAPVSTPAPTQAA